MAAKQVEKKKQDTETGCRKGLRAVPFDPAAIRLLFLDIDGVLLDFPKSARRAIQEACLECGIPCSEELLLAFEEVSDGLWPRMEKGTLQHDEFIQIRWNLIFKKLKWDRTDGPDFEEVFRRHLHESAVPIDNTESSLSLLKKRFPLIVATNGPTGQQAHRLFLASLGSSFADLVSSEMAGKKKPDPAFFDLAWERARQILPDLKRREVALIGDSAAADMLGAAQAGIQSIYFGNSEKLSEEEKKLVSAAGNNWQEILDLLDIRDFN